MTDSGAILSDNIHNLLGNLEEDLMFDIQRSKLFGYLTDDWELSEPNTERKMHTLGTLLHFRGLECTDIFILDRNDSTFFCNYLKNGSTFADFENKEIYHRILETQEALFPAKGCTIWRSCEDSPDELYMTSRSCSVNTILTSHCTMSSRAFSSAVQNPLRALNSKIRKIICLSPPRSGETAETGL